MNIINKILEFKLAIIFVFILGSLIKGQVVITELFITPTINIKIPQYIEIYNTSLTDTINLEGWLLKTYVLYDQGELESCTFTEIENSNSYLRINSNLLIPPNSYYLISSYSEGSNYIFYNENKADIELFFKFYEINTLLSPCNGCEDVLVTGGKIILYELDDDEKLVEHDIVVFDSNNWVINEDSWGHSFSLRGEPNISFNDFSENWFLSPVTERSLYLGEDYNQIQNYGSPKEENSFNLLYPLQDSIIVINNDVNNFHSINNYNDPLLFTWDGTFDDYIGQKYRLIINKLDSWSPNYHGQLTDIIYQNINILDINILDIDTLIMLEDLSINQLEKSNYNWTVELIKGVDTIYSDLSYFSIDASDYGQYGCIDDGCCTDDITLVDPIDDCPRICPTNNIDEFFVSNYPEGCIVGINCFSALNFYKEANIYSNKCHYVSLSMPPYNLGFSGLLATVPLYLYNDSLSYVESLNYELQIDEYSLIDFNSISYPDHIEPFVSDFNAYQDSTKLIVDITFNSDSLFRINGLLNYLNFNLSDSIISSDVFFSNINITGGTPNNNVLNSISIPTSNGEIIIKENNHKISGIISYYESGINEAYEIPNVKLTLAKNHGANPVDSIFYDVTNDLGAYSFQNIESGNYSLSFNKQNAYDMTCPEQDNVYVSELDVYNIAQYVTGKVPLDSLTIGELITADVSLDGTISGLDASLVSQYIVGYIDQLNEENIHWIFKPIEDSTLAYNYAKLVANTGQYSIEYNPLLFSDERHIYGYRLGDVTGNYCTSRSLNRNVDVQTKNINNFDKSNVLISINLTNPQLIKGLFIEVGYDVGLFEPENIIFDDAKISNKNFNYITNLDTKNGSIKLLAWAIDNPKEINGKIGEFHFKINQNNFNGEIWINEFSINERDAQGGIDIGGNDSYDIININNQLVPSKVYLKQNYPNPFNPETSIYWYMSDPGKITLTVYNINGQLIEILLDKNMSSGYHNILWDAKTFTSGIYFYRLVYNDDNFFQNKMILIK